MHSNCPQRLPAAASAASGVAKMFKPQTGQHSSHGREEAGRALAVMAVCKGSILSLPQVGGSWRGSRCHGCVYGGSIPSQELSPLPPFS